MSFDVYFQPFASGDAGTAGRDSVVGVLSPYLWPSPDAPSRIVHPEGTADVYGLTEDSMMVNHVEGAGLWSLLVEAARAGRWAIMPIGCPVCVFDEAMLADLPDELRSDAAIVESAAEVVALIAGS